MDASDVLGALSFGIQALQLFGSCGKGYQALLKACEMDSDLSVLRCRLEIEIQRFRLWGEASDIADGNLDVSARHAPVAMSTLQCLDRLISDQINKIARYHASSNQIGNSPPNRSLTDGLSSTLGSVSRHTRWVLSDRQRIESTMNEIKAINDSLVSLLGQSRQAEIAQSFRELSIRVLGTNDPAKLEILRLSAIGQYDELSALTALKSLRVAMDMADKSSDHPQPNQGVGSSMADRPLVWIDLPLTGQMPAWGNSVDIYLVDRERFIFEWVRLPGDLTSRSKSLSRIQWVAQFLEQSSKVPDLRSPRFSGLSMHPSQEYIALVYRFPDGSSDDLDPVSLDHVLSSTHRHGTLPSLNDRLALAVALARSLLSLHASGWLHKSICPANIMFFYSGCDLDLGSGSYPPGLITRPYLKGFVYSRRSEDGASAQENAAHSESIESSDASDFYRHPSTFQTGASRRAFKKSHDLYSFGILLLEIGLWKRCKPDKDNLQPSEVRKMLCKTYLQGDLAYRAGTTYQEVVRTCLMGDFGDEKSEKNWLEIQFLKRAVQKLESCRF